MSDPAFFFVDDQFYYHRYAAREVSEWLFWGPDLLDPYLRLLSPPMPEVVDEVAFAGFALFSEEKRLLWFSSDEDHMCLFTSRLIRKLQRALWPDEWTLEWAPRGLHTLLERTGRKPGPLLPPCSPQHGHLYLQMLEKHLGKEPQWGTVGTASVRYLDGGVSLHPVTDGDVTQCYLWAGPERIIELLHLRLPRTQLQFPQGENPCGWPGGLHLDFSTKILGHWSHDPNRSQIPASRWEGWTIIDWEDRFEEQIKATDGKLTPAYPPLETLLAQLERGYVPEDPHEHSLFARDLHIYDENDEPAETIKFPLNLEQRRARWNRALKATGLDKPPYPQQW